MVIYCDESNNLYSIIKRSDVQFSRFDTPEEALYHTGVKDALLILADNYPHEQTRVSDEFYRILKAKNIRAFIEFPSDIPNIKLGDVKKGKHERVVIASNCFKDRIDSLNILAINGLHYIQCETAIESPYIISAKVAGFDSAVFGLPDKVDPLLFKLADMDILISTTGLSNFISGRYAPQKEWGIVWQSILEYLVPEKNVELAPWTPEVTVTYGNGEVLPINYQRKSIKKGVEWYTNAKILIADSFSDSLQHLVDSGIERIEWNRNIPTGKGTSGSIECVFSEIDENGRQPLGIIVRGDCVCETAMAHALSGNILNNDESLRIAQNLLDFYLLNSIATKKEYGDTRHGAYGLIPWGISNHAWYKASYGDDNARLFLASIITSAILKTDRWNYKLMRSLLALLRTTGHNGFQGSRIDLGQLEENGWKYYQEQDVINLSPHFEAYLWACFIWAYNQTGDELFLEKAERGISIIMENYPDNLVWTNGLSQEKARMLLPLSWLLRVRDTEKNREMLLTVVDDVLALQDTSGAIREELGSIEMGRYPPPKSNKSYGAREASLIAENGDPVSDLLYTANFAFLGLHEASYALKEFKVREATDKLAEFFCRIQVESENHPELHGGWMRAFDFGRFEHWGSNADPGWGAWVVESGWTQGWITSVLSLRELDTSIWDLTGELNVSSNYESLKDEMFK